ncbi:MAG TPA: threonine dehydratase [Vicinamibacterales bacterium]|nr:threonine dehydratase [Vicinamibacterales bacterium]
MTTTSESPLVAPTLNDVYQARERVAPHVPRTPLMRHPLLDEATGLSIWVKHENHNPTGAFKVRGGLNLVGAMTAEERARGIVTASTGNHGQSIALASRIHGVQCTVFVPTGNNPEKNAAIRAFGAVLDEGGRDFDEARERCERRAAETGARYVHSADEPMLIAGVGTYALEVFEELPEADVIFVALGGGSGACGLITVRNALGSNAKIIAVGAANADAVHRSWKGPERVVGTSADTFAEGIATRVSFDLPFSIYKEHLDGFILLTEEELAEGVRLALKTTHNLAEGAGAAAIAAAYKQRETLAGRRVVCVMSGGNIDAAKLKMVLGA